YAASMLTEVGIYFRCGKPRELRKLLADPFAELPKRILFDTLWDVGWREPLTDDGMIDARRSWIEKPQTFLAVAPRPIDAPVRAWLLKFAQDNLNYLNERWAAISRLADPLPITVRLYPGNFTASILSHQLVTPAGFQERYDEVMLARVRMVCDIVGLQKPETFLEALDMQDELDNCSVLL
ncbi:MAG TPA: hypothetical protein VEA59_06415, partial [Patescibacteria group bacterium]|nr:hypothetical protein [Patescibacteria group bacterium]